MKNCMVGATTCKKCEKNCIVGSSKCKELYCGSYEM